MATTSYRYRNNESLGDIASKFNTSIKFLVKLNSWLKSNEDSHTYAFPARVPQEFRKDEIVVPLVGNGNSSIEDYWKTVTDNTGLSYKKEIDNLIASSKSFETLSDDIDSSEPTLVNFETRLKSSTVGNMNRSTNIYVSQLTDTYKHPGVDIDVSMVGNIIQSELNAGSANIGIVTGTSTAFRGIGSTYNQKYKTTREQLKTLGSVSSNTRKLSETYRHSIGKYGTLGNPNIIKGQCQVIIDGHTLYMPCWPENVSGSIEANYNEQNPLGRSEPYQVYSNTGVRALPFTFKMHREMTGNISEIEDIVRWIESGVYPEYGSNSNVAPVRTSVRIGNSIYISGVMVSVDVNWEGPIGPDDKYNMVTVSFTVRESTGSSKSSSKIRSIGDYRT